MLVSPADLEISGARGHLWVMNYVLAILLPTVSILLAGRPFLAIVLTPVWVLALIFTGGLTHPMFILLAWFIIFERRQARRTGGDPG